MSDATPKTWFAGKTAPEDQQGVSPFAVALGVFVLASPVGVVVAFILGSLFLFRRVTVGFVTKFALVSVGLLVILGAVAGPASIIQGYLSPWFSLLADFKSGDGVNGFGFLWDLLTSQIWVSVPIGASVAAGYSQYKWSRRPDWEVYEKPVTAATRRKKTRNAKQIANHVFAPRDAKTIGTDKYGEIVVQSDEEAAAHTFVTGGSGAGKTTTILLGIRDVIARGDGVIFVDLKGGADVPKQLAQWAYRHGRRFQHWSIQDVREPYRGPSRSGPAYYDPLARGTASRKKDLLMGSQDWSNDYYKTVVSNYLQLALIIAEYVPDQSMDSFTEIAHLLDPKKLEFRAAKAFKNAAKTIEGQQIISSYGENEVLSRWWENTNMIADPRLRQVLLSVAQSARGMDEQERSGIRGMGSRVQILTQSTAGNWLQNDPDGEENINFRETADNGDVVCISLDSSNYEDTSSILAGLIIQDLKTLSSELRTSPAQNPVHVYIDEFSAIGSTNITGLLSKARDARMPVTLITQTQADLKEQNPAFLEQVLGIVSCFLIHRPNTEHEAEIFAGLTGQHQVYKQRYGVETTTGFPGGIGQGAATGQGQVELVTEYRVTTAEIQSLDRGQCVYVAKAPTRKEIYPVDVGREDPDAFPEESTGYIPPREDEDSEESFLPGSDGHVFVPEHGEAFSGDSSQSIEDIENAFLKPAPRKTSKPLEVPGWDEEMEKQEKVSEPEPVSSKPKFSVPEISFDDPAEPEEKNTPSKVEPQKNVEPDSPAPPPRPSRPVRPSLPSRPPARPDPQKAKPDTNREAALPPWMMSTDVDDDEPADGCQSGFGKGDATW